MENQAESINPDTVISMDDNNQILISHPTFRADEFTEELSSKFHYEINEKVEKWFEKGAECKILVPGKPWRKGKIRVRLEFIPDTAESSLDDIRQAIEDND